MRHLSEILLRHSQDIPGLFTDNFEIVQKYPMNLGKTNQKDMSSRTGGIPILTLYQSGSKPTNRLKDTQEIQNYFYLVYKHSRQASKNFRKITHPELKISLN